MTLNDPVKNRPESGKRILRKYQLFCSITIFLKIHHLFACLLYALNNKLTLNILARLFYTFLSKGDHSLLEMTIKMNFTRPSGNLKDNMFKFCARRRRWLTRAAKMTPMAAEAMVSALEMTMPAAEMTVLAMEMTVPAKEKGLFYSHLT